jgi:Malonate decarboxylase, alpha subunit, transporter
MTRQYQIICAGKRETETMSEQRLQQAFSWTRRREEKERRMQAVMRWMSGPVLPTDRTVEALEALVVAGDRIVLEGDNQKQADFLSRSLVKVDAKKVHDLHLIISSISRPEHLTLFELGIAKKVDFAFAGSQRVFEKYHAGAIRLSMMRMVAMSLRSPTSAPRIRNLC